MKTSVALQISWLEKSKKIKHEFLCPESHLALEANPAGSDEAEK